uniref:Membrane-bound lytic murein transglycosylase D n=1 Tax=Candidatus Kentrum sp. DK TaxID=2126562 RepID=A0A450THA4_9GAMM|nr:MAG: membrane-bound lytic murein transglycosylase D [Candidatus Kentron sp. DK]
MTTNPSLFFRPFLLLLLVAVLGAMAGCASKLNLIKDKEYDDAWDRARASLALQDAYGAREVRERLDWFRQKQNYLDRCAERGSRYFYHILEEVERRDMPGEIALLPIVESAFQPFAYSPAHASGIWQFIPATGRRFGLKQNWWYDGRRDIPASTRAALDYLQQLHGRFDGDWLLAVAAYNTGEGNVERAVKRNRKAGKPTDFWSLDLATETRGYVPQLLALAAVVKDPGHYGLTLKKIPNRPYFRQVSTHGPIELSLAAKAAGISLDTLKNLNPGFRRWATDPAGPHRLLLPEDKVKRFEKALAAIPREERVRWHRHVVKKGETLKTIATWFKAPESIVREINRARGNRLALGRALRIPTAPRANYQPDTSVLAKKKPAKKPRVHVVRSGENLSVIAHRYRISLKSIVAWNGISREKPLMPGQKLQLHSPEARKKTQEKLRFHVVRPGENLSVIAKKYRIPLNNLIAWNNISRGKVLMPGQRLRLYR